jgi:hypothetical protein
MSSAAADLFRIGIRNCLKNRFDCSKLKAVLVVEAMKMILSEVGH